MAARWHAELERRLLERTVELATKTGAFDPKKPPRSLRIAIDSGPLEGAGRVEGTFNLLGHAARHVVERVAQLLQWIRTDRRSTGHHEQFLASRYFGSLDGLRAISIVAVVWHHVGGHRAGILGQGDLGVYLFFAISGLLITTLLLREKTKTGTISLRGFYIRRTLRIFPLYYAVLAVYVGLVAFMERSTQPGTQFFANLPFYLTYTSNWFVDLQQGNRVIFYFAWSLATEEQFYPQCPETRHAASLARFAHWQQPGTSAPLR